LKFELITRRGGHRLVLDALHEAAGSSRLRSLKLNCVVIRGVNDDEVVKFVEMTRNFKLEVRFIEYFLKK
jgi:cyclic pyranopterin phosphate synthase